MITDLLKILLGSGILWLFYRLVLAPERMFFFNRLYLLFSIVFPLLLPFIQVSGHRDALPLSTPATGMQQAFTAIQEKLPEEVPLPLHESINPFLVVYVLLSSLLLLRFLKNMAGLLRQTKNSRRPYGGATLVLMNDETLPHSFFHYIFVSATEFRHGDIEREILQHELAHVRQGHSFDILLAELLTICCWFNPFLFALKKELRLNHEFLADEEVIAQSTDVNAYQQLLLQKISTVRGTLTSSFNYLLTKKRLIMMTRTSSPLLATTKAFATLPLVLSIVMLLSTRVFAQEETNQKTTDGKEKQNAPHDTTVRLYRLNRSIGYSQTDAPEPVLRAYDEILGRHQHGAHLTWSDISGISAEERRRLIALFRQMSLEQQMRQSLIFQQPLKPFEKEVPGEKQLDAFRNPAIYGVWVDGQKIPNAALEKYTHKDFAHVFISKLYGAARKGRSYTHQVDLMTNAYYAQYYEEGMKKYNDAIASGDGEMVLIRPAREGKE